SSRLSRVQPGDTGRQRITEPGDEVREFPYPDGLPVEGSLFQELPEVPQMVGVGAQRVGRAFSIHQVSEIVGNRWDRYELVIDNEPEDTSALRNDCLLNFH